MTTTNKAIDALDGMKSIVERDQLVVGAYHEVLKDKHDLMDFFGDEFVENIAETAVKNYCGTRYCAIGSLFAGAGYHEPDFNLDLISSEDRRFSFMSDKPGLKLAYDKLNEAADAYGRKHRLGMTTRRRDFKADIEHIFEKHFDNKEQNSCDTTGKLTRDDLLNIIDDAKIRVDDSSK